MQTISLNILQIIETVYGAGYETKRGEDNQRWPQQIPLQQIVAEEDRRKDEYVFEPLQRAKQLDVVYHRCKFTSFLRNFQDRGRKKMICSINVSILDSAYTAYTES